MQSYDQKYFDAKANRRAGTTWLTLMIIVTIYYLGKLSGGIATSNWYIILCVLGWGQYLFGGIMLKVKGMDYFGYKWILGFGYLLFFAFIMWTTVDTTSYVFILPLISILILYKNPKLIKWMMWFTVFVMVSSNLYKAYTKGMMEFLQSADGALQFAIVFACYACTNMAIKHLVESDGALTGSIEENLKRVVPKAHSPKLPSIYTFSPLEIICPSFVRSEGLFFISASLSTVAR